MDFRDNRRRNKNAKAKKRFNTHEPRNKKDKRNTGERKVSSRVSKDQNKLYAQETLNIIKTGKVLHRNIRHHITNAKRNTCYYGPDDTPLEYKKGKYNTLFEVKKETTLQGCERLSKDTKVLALNFASAKNPGGGFLKGSVAQEESLARSSALYECIKNSKMYKINNDDNNNCFYSHAMIYSPDVPVFRRDTGELIDSYNISFITSPAVNAGHAIKHESRNQINKVMTERIDRILSIAAYHEYDTIILGSYGCGVFGNNTNTVATTMMTLLTTKYLNVFNQVTFSVLDQEDCDIFSKVCKHLNRINK
jgi:uncharacterized protein (TIGR02452 family)